MAGLRPYREHDPDFVAVALARIEGRAVALGLAPHELPAAQVAEIASEVAKRFGYEWPAAYQAVLERLAGRPPAGRPHRPRTDR
jgi:hypothetical protein